VSKDKELTEEEIRVCSEAMLSQPHESFETDMRRTDGRMRLEMGKSIAGGRYRDEIEIVSGLSIPLAILHGENEQIVNLNYIRGLKIPTLWRNDVQVITEAGHAPQWEQPETFNRLLEAFIEDAG